MILLKKRQQEEERHKNILEAIHRESKAKEAAADAYVRALTENPSGDPNGACFEAAQELL